MPAPAEPELEPPVDHRGYRPKAVSRYTSLPLPTIYRACARGEIQHVRIGDTIIIGGREVRRLIGATP